ncbi:CocE/NonD family hydrolase [Nocardia brasiliensis]|uniref:CocE/NonD family hydrolase n=1 Tax=Nocardia brasiliensis TaxID=37326 RepID=UPI003D8B59B2
MGFPMLNGARSRLCGLVIAATAIAGFVVVPAHAAPDGGASAADWLATYEEPPKYPAVHIDWDVPITMPDGTVLKANVYRPADANGPIAEPTPTIVNVTSYTKLMQMLVDSAMSIPVLYDALGRIARMMDFSAFGLSGLSDFANVLPGGAARMFAGVDRKLIQSGYTQVMVDVRGTGFSQGVWQALGPVEQQDTVDIVEWAARQPWSNGRIGMTGMSYTAVNQLHAAQLQAPSLQALFAVNPGSDLLRDFAGTGGALGVGFIAPWAVAVEVTKLIPDLVALFSGNFDWKWFEDRLESPAMMLDLLLGYLFSVNPEAMPPVTKDVLDPASEQARAWRGGTDQITTPTFISGGWHDLFAYSEVKAFNNIPLPPSHKKLIMADTYHGTPGTGFGAPNRPPRLDVLQRAWFDKWLKDVDNGIDSYDPVVVYQQGGGWVGLDQFPRPDVDYRRMYLSATPSRTTAFPVLHDGSLIPDAPNDNQRLTAGPGLVSICSRDSAQILAGGPATLDLCGKDNRVAELNALTFTSAPVAGPTTLSGPMALHLNTVYDTADGYWTATVNDVAPDGRSTVLTSGQLVASLRRVDESRATRSPGGDYTDPYPLLSLAEREPTVPGQPTVLDIGLVATDAVLQPGHRLRIDVYASNFPRGLPMGPALVDSRLAPQHLQLDPAEPSFVNIPLGGAPGW